MTIPEIIKELDTYTGRFPMQAMKAAIQQREAITPELLQVLETAAANPEDYARREGHMLHMFALYLLAQFREKRAYRPIVKMFSAPGETPFELAGDTVTEGLKRIFGSVYDGDPEPLQRLIENENANEYVRNAAIYSFVVLEHADQISRDEVTGFFRGLYQGKLKRNFSYVWTGLAIAVANLPAPELLEEVRRTFQEDLAEGGMHDFHWIESKLLNPDLRNPEQYTLITNAIEEMEWWASFNPQPSAYKRLSPFLATALQTASMPGHVTAPPSPRPPYMPPVPQEKTGRNDPCPCGSGKKYKKCCLKN